LGLAALGAMRVRIDASNRSMNAERAEDVALERVLRDAFGARQEMVFALAAPDALGRDGIARLAALEREIAALPGVARTTSLASAVEVRAGAEGVELAPLLPDGAGRDDAVAALA